MIELKFKLLYPDSIAPKRATDGSAGLDLPAHSFEYVGSNNYITQLIRIKCGLAFEIPKGYVGILCARSSICNTNYTLTNGVGIIDSDYRGEVSAVFEINHSRESRKTYEKGDFFCQLVLVELPKYELVQVDELTPTERGSGGYGSTDKK